MWSLEAAYMFFDHLFLQECINQATIDQALKDVEDGKKFCVMFIY